MSEYPADLPLTDLVRRLPSNVPFVGPEALERQRGRAFRVRAGANESSFGISPAVRAAMTAALDSVHCYNDPEGYELRCALAAKHGVDVAEIALGSGIDDLLGLFVRAFAGPGDCAVTSLGAYPTFNYHVAGYGGELKTVPYRDDHEDAPALLDAASSTGASLLYLANPDNPMGTWQQQETLTVLMASIPAHCVLLLDEAYVDLAPPADIPPVDPSNPRVVRLRTFSKVYGMAGSRIGYAIAHRDIVAMLDKIRNHFGVNRIAQAGALAALQDIEFVQDVVHQVAVGRDEYAAAAVDVGLRAVSSATNFVALDAGSSGRAEALMGDLLARDIFVRKPSLAPLDRCVRITVVLPEERKVVIEALRASLRS